MYIGAVDHDIGEYAYHAYQYLEVASRRNTSDKSHRPCAELLRYYCI